MTELARAGALIGCAGLAIVLVAPRRDLRIAGLALWALGLAGLGAYLAPDGRTGPLAAASAGIVVVAGLGGWLLLRYPYLLAFATLACVPARIPLEVGDEEANLLLPLYGVIAAAAVALAWRLLQGDERSRELGPIAWPLATFVAWTGVTFLWSDDVRDAAIFVGAFVLPFGVLAVSLARLPWRGRWLTWLWGALAATAMLYATIGVYQWATREVFWNPKVIVGNAYAPFFRVNSVFWDPSIYGRYLVVAILATLAGVLLGAARGRSVAILYVVIAVTWFGLLISYSQSSFVALATGVAAAAVVVWRWRAVAGLAAFACVLAAVGLGVPQVRGELVDQAESGLDDVTSGRASLVGQGIRIALDHPLLGVGVGGFQLAYAERVGLTGSDPARAASHTTPVTIAAETGIPGLALFGWLVVAALAATFGGLGSGFTSRVALAVGLTLLAITVHSLFYAGLFEDPMTWALLGLVGLAARVPKRSGTAVSATTEAVRS